MDNQCDYLKPTGQRCRAAAREGDTRCWFHTEDPECVRQRQEARQAGGRERSKRTAVLPLTTPDAPLASVQDVAAFLGLAVNRVARGELDPKVGNCLGLLCGQLLKAIEGGEVERRLAALEEQLHTRRAS